MTFILSASRGRSRTILSVVLSFAISWIVRSQTPPSQDPAVTQIVSEISPSNIKRTVSILAGFGTRHTLSDTASDARGIGAARRWIRAAFERSARASGGRMTIGIQSFITPPSPRIPHPVRIDNIIATLVPPGQQQGQFDRAYLVCAHYDSRASDVLDSTGDAPGADDDGSGTAVVLELARVMSTHEFRAPIVFAAFAGEEQGLLGSTFAAESALSHHQPIGAVLSNDIVGGVAGGDGETDSSSVRIFSGAFTPADTGATFRSINSLGLENDGASRSLARYVEEVGRIYVPGFHVRMIYRRDRFLRSGDHIPFHERGYPAIRLSESKENFDRQHHNIVRDQTDRIGDLPAFVNAQYCANIARINAAALASLAIAPPPPAHAQVGVKNLSYDTELRWNRVAAGDIAGYYIRYRDTDASRWEGEIFTADTTLVIRHSKDDQLFAVQSVGAGGSRSLYVLPRPSR